MSNEILVIGATGKTGKRVAERLEARGLAVRYGTRRSAIPFDWENPETWRASLAGINSAYVAYSPDLAVPSAHGVIAAFVKAAEEAASLATSAMGARRIMAGPGAWPSGAAMGGVSRLRFAMPGPPLPPYAKYRSAAF